jgi:hypothetical protein
MSARDRASAGAPESAPRRAHDPVTCAIDLGWRLAALYAEVERLHIASHELHAASCEPSAASPEPRRGSCLPCVEGLPESDRVVLYLRAAASVGRRMGADERADEIDELVPIARDGLRSAEEVALLRADLRKCHMALTMHLWATQEAYGKAFELGTSLFDTWHRVAAAAPADKDTAWREVFAPERVKRLKVRIDDLESRLTPVAVTVVRAHLERWEWRAQHRSGLADDAECRLSAQVNTWRQLLTGDKAPEAFLSTTARRDLHREFSGLVRRSFWRPAPIACVVLVAAVAAALMFGGSGASEAARLAVAPLGAIGLSKASLAVVARDRLRAWTTLLWNRAVATVLFEVTCHAGALIVPAPRHRSVAGLQRAGAVLVGRLPWPTLIAPDRVPAPQL